MYYLVLGLLLTATIVIWQVLLEKYNPEVQKSSLVNDRVSMDDIYSDRVAARFQIRNMDPEVLDKSLPDNFPKEESAIIIKSEEHSDPTTRYIDKQYYSKQSIKKNYEIFKGFFENGEWSIDKKQLTENSAKLEAVSGKTKMLIDITPSEQEKHVAVSIIYFLK